MLKEFFKKIRHDDIGELPWEYDFLLNLPESEYPKYLKKIFKIRTGEDLPLKSLKSRRGGDFSALIMLLRANQPQFRI